MPAIDDGLTTSQASGILKSQDQARQLLAQGHSTLVNARHFDPVKDQVLSSWAMGAEALLKSTLALYSVAAGKGWTERAARSYGHKIDQMDTDLATHIDQWMAESARSDYLQRLVSRVRDDPTWPILRRALHVYAKEGRFSRLDAISGREQDEDPLAIFEQAMESARANSDLTKPWRSLDLATASASDMDNYSLSIHAALAESLVHWWFMITRLARHGFLGPRGIGFGADTEPQNAIPRINVRGEH